MGGRLVGSATTDFSGTATCGVVDFTATGAATAVFEFLMFLEGSIVEKIGNSESVAMASSIVFFLVIPPIDRS